MSKTSTVPIDRRVAVTQSEDYYHRLTLDADARLQVANCSIAMQSSLSTVMQSDAEAAGYEPCPHCDWVTVYIA